MSDSSIDEQIESGILPEVVFDRELIEERAYWLDKLGPVLDQAYPAIDFLRVSDSTPNVAAQVEFELGEESYRALMELTGGGDFLTYTVLVTVLKICLRKYTGRSTVIVGSPARLLDAGRSQVANVLPVISELSDEQSVEDLLLVVRETLLEAYGRQRYPFLRLLKELELERSISRPHFFDVTLRLKNIHVELPDLNSTLQIVFEHVPDRLIGQVICRQAGYGHTSVERFINHYLNVLAASLANTELLVGELSMLDEAERHRVISEWNNAPVSALADIELAQAFAQQAALCPDAVALVTADSHVSYGELQRRSSELANYLRDNCGVGPETRVGLFMGRSVEAVESLLGIIKAGGAYVPLDPGYPLERLGFMLEDAEIQVLLTLDNLLDHLPSYWGQVVCVDRDREQIAVRGQENPALPSTNGNLAYVIYTSGSTGSPKGVAVTRRSVVSLVTDTNFIHLKRGDTVAHASNISFDAATFEIWGALLNGARLIIVPPAISLEPVALAALLKRQQVSIYFVTTALFNQMAQQVPSGLAAVEQVLFGGEAVDPRWVRRVLEESSGGLRRLLHVYGPTETTTYASWHEVREVAAGAATVPIGRGVSGTQLYVLDGRRQLAPQGVTGELYIGGEGLARGYLNSSELTAERFVPDGCSNAEGARLYRTGDLVRHREDGAIEYVGRVDHQVKLRGFRIELGEIEAALRRRPEVEDAVVILSGDASDQNKRLVAYVVSEREPNVSHYQKFLRERLPEYMTPAVFVRLDQLPLTANGKVDRDRLPDPGLTRPTLADDYARAETEVEQALVEVWADVLGLDQVGIDDNFFELGGDSIRSIQLVAKAQEQNLTFTIQQLFEYSTIRELSQFVDAGGASVRRSNSIAPFQLLREEDRALLPTDVEDAYPLTRMQSGILFHTEFSPETSVYRDLVSNHIRAQLNEEAMKLAVTRIIERHPVLRTSFHLTGFSEPLQLVHRQVDLPLEMYDLRALSVVEQDRLLSESFEAEKVLAFDCEQAPLLRLRIYRRSEDSFQFMMSLHHVIIDGWSLATMLTELFHCYWYLLGEVAEDVGPAPQSRFSEYVALERIALESEESRQYWLRKLSDGQQTKLPRWRKVDHTSTVRQVRERRFDLPPDLFEGVNRMTAGTGVPLKSVLLAAHFKVLEVLMGQQDLLTGLGSHGRPEGPDGVRVLGLFLNILPCRLRLKGGTWTELIKSTFDVEREMMAHSRFPLVEMQRAMGRQTLFETVFNFLHYHIYQSLDGFRKMELLDERSVMETNFPLVVNFTQHALASGLTLNLMYDDNELQSEQVAAIEGYFARTLARMSSQPDEQCGLFSPLSDDELQRLVFQWNETQPNHSRERCVHQVFEEQAERRTDTVAISYENRDLTYGELNRRANQLAHHLRSLGCGSGMRVGLWLRRSPEVLVCMLAALKAGAAYLPIDISYPPERVAMMLDDAEAQVLLVEEHRSPQTLEQVRIIIDLTSERDLIARQPGHNPDTAVTGLQPACVIYTSGSTGRPKGIVLSHSGINHLLFNTNYVDLGPDERITQASNISFDAATFEIWSALLHGARLIIVPASISLEPLALAALLREEQVSIYFVTTALFNQMAQQVPWALAAVKQVFFGGEAVDPRWVRQVLETSGGPGRLLHMYGPAESTTYASWYEVREVAAGAETVPIGRGVSGTQLYVFDGRRQLAPVGVTGELYVGGEGLAHGYLGQAALTAEVFVPDGYSKASGARLYRTGDLVRYREDGALEYVGRVDQQVKVRGFRVEPGEIESVMMGHPDVETVVVEARRDAEGNNQLVAYVVSQLDHASSSSEWRRYLRERLPEYMVPAVFMILPKLPLTPNGKVDRRQLPEPGPSRPRESDDYVAPETAVERALAEVWAEVLGLDQVGIGDNFFELGGDSILCIQVVARARQRGYGLTARQVFEHPTIAELSGEVKALGKAVAAAERVVGAAPLTPIQCWFFEQEFQQQDYWNQAVLLRTEGLRYELLSRLLKELLEQHDALRMRYRHEDGEWRQWNQAVDECNAVPLWIDLRSLPAAQQERVQQQVCTALQASLDLSEGRLLRLAVFERSDEKGEKEESQRLLLVVHHLVVDGVSWRILLEDLQRGYEELRASGRVKWPAKSSSFQQWGRRLEEYAVSGEWQAEQAYWSGAKWSSGGRLRLDHEGGANTVSSAGMVVVELGAEETRALLQEVTGSYQMQVPEVLLTALVLSLGRQTGSEQWVVELEGHGREELFAELEVTRTVGWFTSVYPLWLEVKRGSGAGAALKGVKEQVRVAPGKGLGYGVLRYLGSVEQRAAMQAVSAAEISFNYLGQFDQTLRQASLFQLTKESVGLNRNGEQRRTHLLDIGGSVEQGCLRMRWMFSENLHRRETIEELAQGFIEELRDLIAHCLSAETVEYTPSDFTRIQLSQSELDDILVELERSNSKPS